MMRSLILFTIIFTLTNYASAGCYLGYSKEDCGYRNFFDFGPKAGDFNLTKLDDHYVLVQKPISFKFFDKYFQSFYLSSNGLIKLLEKNSTVSSQEEINLHHYTEHFPILNKTLIAPYWVDMITGADGDVFYRLVTDKSTLNDVSFEIDRLTKANYASSYKPSWVAIVTWYQMKSFMTPTKSHKNTFQLIMTTNGEDSYVLFNYGRLQWPSENAYIEVEAGFNFGDNVQFFRMEGSGTHNISQLENKSNVNMRSKWLFKVDSYEEFLSFSSKDDKDSERKPAYLTRFWKIYNRGERTKFYLAILAITSCLYAFVLTCALIWKYFTKRRQYRAQPRLQMAYHKQLNDSSANLTENL